MQKRTKLGLVMIAVFTIVAVWQHEGVAHAQTTTVIGNLTDAQTGEVVLAGVLAGLVMAYQKERSATTPVSAFTFLDMAVQTTIASVPIAIVAALTETTLNLLGLLLVFFAAMGIQVQAQLSKQPTITSAKRVKT